MSDLGLATVSEHAMTNAILAIFEELSRVPRRSKHEEEIRAWAHAWADRHGLANHCDAVGNVVIEVPASPGKEGSPTVVLQGHLDMVCEKTPESTHDFTKDPIALRVEDGWLTATDTTLGADNGIAVAMALALATSDLPHPPLELLFTVDEESGMTGANAITDELFKGRVLLNIDSEDEGVLTVGCAGGCSTAIEVRVSRDAASSDPTMRLEVGGLKGGHSGVDIALGRGNAIRLLARALRELLRESETQIVSLAGGSAHNAIPRDAQALITIPPGASDFASELVARCQETFRQELPGEPTLRLWLEPAENTAAPLTTAAAQLVLDTMLSMPHGVACMSAAVDGLVETSNNFAKVTLEGDTLVILSSQRSSVMSRLQALTDRVETVARLAGGTYKTSDGYPPWQPNMDSPLLATCVALYQELFGRAPVVEIIHAGLECGIIGDRIAGMDMVSLGPTIKYPHCPDERLEIATIGMVWDYLAALMARI